MFNFFIVYHGFYFDDYSHISKNNKSPYKILDTSHNYKTINVGVGGKNKRKTIKKK